MFRAPAVHSGYKRPDETWKDDHAGKLETRLAELVMAIARAAELSERQWHEEVWQREEQRKAEAQVRTREEQERIVEERRLEEKRRYKKAVKQLVRAAQGTAKSHLIREYVQRTRERLSGAVTRGLRDSGAGRSSAVRNLKEAIDVVAEHFGFVAASPLNGRPPMLG
ncbi:hypothetical protein [Devosia nitrariae]|uniref:Uncharacterized protein n=1 Tax=Devosia nitrariae TaxID=2071872 RepID=A0ABQ5W6E6_9HYPH|nr:hypothetical protein [Devosia nitrariae]GLQ55429.1 hypothetical protein GCM10010862_26880 [Devosia nitrariae]